MKDKIILTGYLFIAGLLLNSCKEPFNPTVKTNNSNLLVVEGFINSGADSTIIKLNRTTPIADKGGLRPEIDAVVNVESETNEVFPLKPEIDGTYAALALNLDPGKKYRLNIKTTGGETYQSDFVEVKAAPPIDNVYWELKDGGVEINLDAHDSNNKTIYYRWEYVETWIFYARFKSLLKWNGTSLIDRDLINDNIYQCWGNQISSTILLGSTATLNNDVIYKKPITFNSGQSEKFSERYSIIVKQYALTKEAYDFWQRLKKNTESLGSIFDAQPSVLTGNIHNINDPDETVIGYISAGTTQQKRIYIAKSELPYTFKVAYPYYGCDVAADLPGATAKDVFGAGFSVPISPSPTGFYASSRECADCTIRGTNRKPAFWQ